MRSKIDEIYGNRVRVRVSGLCWQGDSLLLVNHAGLGPAGFWAPPGGGVEFGETAQERLVREFGEETGLTVDAGAFLFACEFIKEPLHAVELFFEATARGGRLKTGYDPEMSMEDQIIQDVLFMPYDRILALAPEQRHGVFRLFKTPDSLKKATGYRKI